MAPLAAKPRTRPKLVHQFLIALSGTELTTAAMTQAGMILGTVAYLSPEQA